MAPQQQTAGQPAGAWSSRRGEWAGDADSAESLERWQDGRGGRSQPGISRLGACLCSRRLGKGGRTSGDRCSSATYLGMRMVVGSADIPLRVRPQEVGARDRQQRDVVAAVRTGSKDVPPWLVFVHGFVLHGRRRYLLRTILVAQTIDGLGCRVSLGQDRGRNEGRRCNADTPGQGHRSQRDKENRKHGSGISDREREHVAALWTREP